MKRSPDDGVACVDPECIQLKEEWEEPEEGDYTTQDHIHFYQHGKLVVSVPDGDSIKNALVAHMEEEQFWPNVWFISDHGNPILMSLEDHK